ncbi:MAG: hypothetical protein WBD07_06870 [Vicinamibacterales bacterium]
MKHPSRGAIGAMVLAGLIAVTSACVATTVQGRVYVRVGPPAPVVEPVFVRPGPGYIWLPGHYAWNGVVYVWVPGRWERPPRVRARWVPAHWEHSRKYGWYFVEGHWR